LSQRSVDFFKRHATEQGTQYQRMIRNLLDAYVDSHSVARARRKSGKKPAAR
jgi:hypothetical protein